MTTPVPVVVDASVAVAIVRNEPDGSAASDLITRHTLDGARIVVPSHFWLEVANTLVARRRWPGSKVLEAIHAIDALRFETVELDRALLILSLDAAERFGLTTYVAAYLALAVSLDGALLTLDGALRTAAGTRALRIGTLRLSETPAAFEHDVTWPDYRGASTFLAKLGVDAARPG
jgi:predicted nucleic acid-binding protein